MMKFRNLVITLMMLLIALCGVVGCGKEETSMTPAKKPLLCIVVANTANSKASKHIDDYSISKAIQDVIFKEGAITIVSADGSPSLVYHERFDNLDEDIKASSEELRRDYASEKTADVLYTIKKNTIANDNEIDFLASIQLASRSLTTYDGMFNPHIIIVGTGINTCGDMKFQGNFLSSVEPDVIATAMEDRRLIPDLEGVSVTWLLTEVDAPQPMLDYAQSQRVIEIWKAVFRKANVKNPDIRQYISVDDAKVQKVNSEYPYVSVITFEKNEIDISRQLKNGYVLNASRLQFAADSSEFLDLQAAHDELKPIANYMQKNSHYTLLIVAGSAGDLQNAYTKELSLSRGAKVKSELMKLAVISNERVKVVAPEPKNNPFHVNHLGIGVAAAKNRATVLLDASTPMAERIVQQCR